MEKCAANECPSLPQSPLLPPSPLFIDATITRDVRQYLGFRFTKNSVDSELQHQIRENLHMRVVPCKPNTHTHTHTHTDTDRLGLYGCACVHVFGDKDYVVDGVLLCVLSDSSQS